ncbi:DoxX family protein [Paenibacillus cymbidii]|uniref:DoxX family protein n=1 Tax=Paenibacillus cymbidii TaxID=1639034 RepID=UPI001081D6B1|nr:DoxX family protein [Paenibacillus cymbidii]
MDILVIVLQSLLALMFVMAGLSKMAGVKMHVDNFTRWRLPQWFRVVTGFVQLVAAAALIVGYWDDSWTAAGALLLALVGIGGILTHVRVRDSLKEMFPILLIAAIAIVLFFLRMSALADFPGFQ